MPINYNDLPNRQKRGAGVLFADTIENRLNYKDWFCGHWHIDKRIEKMHFMMHSVEAL